MTRCFTTAATAALLLATALPAAVAADGAGDAAKGEKLFNRCRSCHSITAPDGTVIQRGGRTGPNLYGVIGRPAGSYEDFRYSDILQAAGEKGLVWSEPELAEYLKDPSGYLDAYAGESGRSRMSFILRKGGSDVAAYLASVGPETSAAAE